MSTKKEALAALGDAFSNESFDRLSGSSHYQDFLSESYQANNSEVNELLGLLSI
ncbi:hypothetical protein M917_1974 [Psychrobacter aquaticus CMS 56]|uniref:Uncharacterized protein n=1 Tax=Psychrobacter aquaticus CMS 56 TaxID=1354303 RepID=U4T4Z6_9GAMM|nr:hypothetical protein M917_1974 [Psychrobacter aquaticus CMS 56]